MHTISIILFKLDQPVGLARNPEGLEIGLRISNLIKFQPEYPTFE